MNKILTLIAAMAFAVIGALTFTAAPASAACGLLGCNPNPTTLTFTSTPPGGILGARIGQTYTPTVTSSRTNDATPIVTSTSTPSVCVKVGTQVNLIGQGTCTVNATQAATSVYAAGAASQSFIVR